MPLRCVDDPKHWRDRADEAFACVDQLHDPDARRSMLRIVATYELLALQAERRQKNSSNVVIQDGVTAK